MPKFTLRPETPEDHDFILQLYASTRADEMALLPWSAEQKSDFLAQQAHLQHQHFHSHYPNAEFSVVMQNHQAVGRWYVERNFTHWQVIDIALLPEYRNQGLGGHLLQTLLTQAQSTGQTVRLHVEQTNRAMRLYLRLGFTVVEERGFYWLMECLPARLKESQ